MSGSSTAASLPPRPAWARWLRRQGRRLVDRTRAGGWDRRIRRGLLVGGLALSGLLVGLVVAFVLDGRAHAGRVARGVQVGGRDVSGRRAAAVAVTLSEVSSRYAQTKVLLSVDKSTSTTDASTIGLNIDQGATVQAAMRTGRTGWAPARFLSWLGSFRRDRRTKMALTVDRSAVQRIALENDRGATAPPAEPTIAIGKKGTFISLPGHSGTGIDVDQLVRDLRAAADEGTPIKVEADRRPVTPRFTKDDADRAVKEAEAMVAQPLAVTAGTTAAILGPVELRPTLTTFPGDKQLEIEVDAEAAVAAAAKAIPDTGTAPVEPRFGIGPGNTVVLVPGKAGTVCCARTSGDALVAAIKVRPPGPVVLGVVATEPKLSDAQAAALGVKEQVSAFTTRHAGGQPRVTNIHRIADMVRGYVIKPGETFSLNDYIGPRTAEKGFVVDHVIEDGSFAESLGGGVSQFATTLFNAAFFAGLDYGEFASHSLYIPRYPKGREATLSFPHPDLQIKNTTPYGVLIWPSYTGTSITVTLYSTRYVDAQQTGQTESSRPMVVAVPTKPGTTGTTAKPTPAPGTCTLVTTQRTRKYLDGRVVVDTVSALYQPREGVICR